jgi:hypothetical protein
MVCQVAPWFVKLHHGLSRCSAACQIAAQIAKLRQFAANCGNMPLTADFCCTVVIPIFYIFCPYSIHNTSRVNLQKPNCYEPGILTWIIDFSSITSLDHS